MHKLRKIAGSCIPDEKIIKENIRRRIIETPDIDYKVFRKSKEEKIRLKVEKQRAKTGVILKRKARLGKEQRQRLYEQKKANCYCIPSDRGLKSLV